MVLVILKDEGEIPIEAVELELCELFHCRPSELEAEDGFKCLQLLNLRRWRDAANAFMQDHKAVDAETRLRLLLLIGGKKDALTMDVGKTDKGKIGELRAMLRDAGKVEKKKAQVKDGE